MSFIRSMLALSIMSVLAGGVLRSAHAHEEGVLSLGRSSVAAGSTLVVSGSDFTAHGSLTLVLRGPFAEYELDDDLEADASGRFQVELEIPADASPGAYRVVAIAPDGDVAARAELELTPAAGSGRGAGSDGDPDAGTEERAAPRPRADELGLERRWSGVEWFVIGALFGGALAGGLALYHGAAPSAG